MLQTEQKSKKWSYLGVVVLLAIFALSWVATLNFISIYNEKKLAETEVKINPQLTAAKKSLDWLDTTRDSSDNIYRINGFCNSTACLGYSLGEKSWREEPYLIWGRYQYYKKTNNAEQLSVLNSDLNFLSGQPMQLVNWGCRLMKDLVSSEVLSDNDRSKALRICAIGGYEGREEFVIYSDEAILEAINKVVNNQSFELEGIDLTEIKQNFSQNAFISADYTAINETKAYETLTFADGQTIPVLNMAKNRFLKALYGYSLMSENERSIYNNSILGVAALDLYKIENKKEYLDFALKLEEFNDNNGLEKEIKDIAYHAFFIKEFSSISGYESYISKFENDIDSLVNFYFDATGYGGNKFDRGAFYDPVNTQYSSILNGLIIGLIMTK